MLSRNDIVAIIGNHAETLRGHGVESLHLFGSVARDEARETSDVDLLVEFREVATFDGFMDLKFLLEQLLGHRVDLVTNRALKPALRDVVEREKLRVA